MSSWASSASASACASPPALATPKPICGREDDPASPTSAIPLEHDTGRGEVVDRGEEWPLDVAQTIDEGGRHDAFGLGAHLRDQALADERRRHRVFVLMAVFIDAHVLERLGIADPVPDEIVAAVPGRRSLLNPE